MSEFKKYRRKQLSEMRPYNKETDKLMGYHLNTPKGYYLAAPEGIVSISEEDIINGSPKEGDMIARNPANHKDLWLVAKKYFDENLEEI